MSTNKEDQLNSLATQKQFFEEFAARYGHHLLRIYADEGISGTKIKNRRQFNELLRAAEGGGFEMVVVKDISRLARNAVDFLQSIRYLKSRGIACNFVNANLSSQDSEMILGTLALVAQEESANISKRIKFSKRLNAEKGRVPNLVYGFDKTPGEYFRLEVNPAEAQVVREIFCRYAEGGEGMGTIAAGLNARLIPTKRGCGWTQAAVSRILHNPLYVGRVINGKQEIRDFLTGVRTSLPPERWLVTERPELRIVPDELFGRAQRVIARRAEEFRIEGKRQSGKYPFSTLIRCAGCGRSFRRIQRQRKAAPYIRWVCSSRNLRGADSCDNGAALDEAALEASIRDYFAALLERRPGALKAVLSEARRLAENGREGEAALAGRLQRLRAARKKQLLLYENDVVTLEQLRQRTAELDAELERVEAALGRCGREDPPPAFGSVRQLLEAVPLDNARLKQVIDRIEASGDGRVEVVLRPL